MTAAVRPPMVPALFAGLLDDAAIFPPGHAPMEQALRAHAAALRGPAAGLLGSFTCSGGRLQELLSALPHHLPDDLPELTLSLVLPDGLPALQPALATVAASSRLQLRSVELPAQAVDAEETAAALAARLPPGAHGYVELPLAADLGAAVRAVGAAGCRVKLRTGGTDAAVFPSAAALASALVACRGAEVPVKLTAGLHHAVRSRDPATGFEHHGFLNMLAAVAAAVEPAPASRLAELLELRDGPALARTVAALDAVQVARVRGLFTGFGTCSIENPLHDLHALGLLGTPA